MRKRYTWILAGLMVAATAATSVAAEYDRYPGGGGPPVYAPPPPMYAPPPPRGAQVPPPRHAQYGQTYFFGHLGVFDPNGDSDGLSGYDSGMNFDLGIGSRVSPVLAVDGTIGGYNAKRGSDEATVVPLTFGGRLILPNPFFEPYFGAGIGLYFSNLKENPYPGFSGIDDSQTDFGGYFSVGADMWLNPRTALNFEGKYNYVDPTFHSNAGNSFGVNLSGWTLNLGIRVAF
jgi:hypothetical protein